MIAHVLHHGAKPNLGRVAPQRDLPRVLQSGARVPGTVQPHSATWSCRKNLERVHPVVQHIGDGTRPVLIVLRSLRQRPQLVSTVVEPVSVSFRRRNVFAPVLRIYEQIRMRTKPYLHQASAQLRHQGKRHPFVADLLRTPTFKVNGASLAGAMLAGGCVADSVEIQKRRAVHCEQQSAVQERTRVCFNHHQRGEYAGAFPKYAISSPLVAAESRASLTLTP